MVDGLNISLIDALEMRTIRRALREVESGPSDDVSKSDFKNWFRDHGNEEFLRVFENAAKRVLIDDLSSFEKFMKFSGSEEGEIIDFDLLDTYYFESFFGYTDHSTTIYSIPQIGGVFNDIRESAESSPEAVEIFQSYCDEKNIDSVYTDASNRYPASIIGSVEDEALPRILKFEDGNHLYTEYWSIGDTFTKFDINEGDYKTIETLARTIVRVHLDTGVIEYTSDDSRKGHRDRILTDIMEKFNVSNNPGGSSNFSQTVITNSDIRTIKENLGLLSTLDSFRGARANLRYTSVDERNVETDPSHPGMERSRDYQKSHPRILIGKKDGEWELIEKRDILDDSSIDVDDDTFGEEDAVGYVVKELREAGRYEEVRQFTIVLNSDKDSFRIWKKQCSPNTRQAVFHLISDEVGW